MSGYLARATPNVDKRISYRQSGTGNQERRCRPSGDRFQEFGEQLESVGGWVYEITIDTAHYEIYLNNNTSDIGDRPGPCLTVGENLVTNRV